MAVYITPLISPKIALGVWVYSGVPKDAQAYHNRLDYDASCNAIWDPREHHAYIQGLSLDCFVHDGRLVHEDYLDISENLHHQYGVHTIEWDRANGKRIKLLRVGPRRWLNCDDE